ncbi:hypothetical protein K7W42_20380 [Deinococcus sp. HMF7604]|uniref:hypothetical protein n=1 Tax=Deinococcus betulae TaxID=2873312 RepID=UPI001CCF1EE0|nr:hypothetical protein [Deinococcus betulae]MBZ9753197.1 hypothetical protein [Deinococcus betulae]
MTLMQIPCPHASCGVTLSVHACTPNGERARCGVCRGRVAFEGGALRAISVLDEVYAACEAFRQAVAHSYKTFIASLRRALCPRSPAPERAARPQPRTLHLALSMPARLALRALDRRPLRSPATRRR